FILILLMAIGLTGFLIEGFRILAKPQVWANWEPVGAFIALWPAGNPTLFHSLFWWIHICLSLFFIAYLPFSKLFHIITGIVNVVLEMSPPDILTLEEREKSAKDFSLKHFIAFDACTRCNRCENKCPSNQSGEALSPREINQKMRDYFRNQFSFISIIKKLLKKTVPEIPIKKAIQGEEPWMCTTCRACIEECPLIINNPDIIRQIRMLKIEEGTQVPVMIGETLESIFKHGNPFQGQKSKRTEWAQGLEVKSLSDKETSEFLYFVGCAPSYDERLQAIAQNTVKIFNKFKMDFSVLGNKESCCGDMAKRLGEDGLLEELIMKNYETFERFKVNRIITACPHGLKMLRDEYPLYKKRLGIENNIKLDVQHYTQLLATHIKEGTIKFRKAFNRRVTYHDPCYLGRHCDIYNPPRDIIKAIPEIEFFEMERNRSNSFCCGGGGGRFMMEEFEAREKISELRVKEAAKIDAQILITACPFCLSMLEDALKTAGYEDKIEVKDISELMVELI
ncbi:MAG: heterodisulfide reductase-related iron-sulfur binding cluster, partial [Thermodesulfobacteriota bacterium]|nr:heterodisulfide reductase-related iron-sulfur binding cluster [Thermodesulfobacteriota bacterium]